MSDSVRPVSERVPESDLPRLRQPAAVPVAYLCHESCKSTAGIFRVEGGHVQSFRYQSDEAFVVFDHERGDGAPMEFVAEQWPTAGHYERISYRGPLFRGL